MYLDIAEKAEDTEYLCAATAHKFGVIWKRIPKDEKGVLLQTLKKMEEKYKPENSELRDLIDSIESTMPSEGQGS